MSVHIDDESDNGKDEIHGDPLATGINELIVMKI